MFSLITILVSLLYLAVPTLAVFGLSYGRGLYTVDTGGGLVFQGRDSVTAFRSPSPRFLKRHLF
jgi:hypothetical protein